jgi:hypothetical protein
MSWPTTYDKDVMKWVLSSHTNTKVLGLRLEEGVLLRLGGLAGSEGGSSRLLSGLSFGRLVIETKSARQPREVDNAPRSSSAVSVETDTAQQKERFIAQGSAFKTVDRCPKVFIAEAVLLAKFFSDRSGKCHLK